MWGTPVKIKNSYSQEVPEEELWRRYKEKGDPKAREMLIERYLPLVRYVVNRLMIDPAQSVDREDLYSYGVIGLIDAVDKFDPEKKVKFKTYAVKRIMGSILDELRKQDWLSRGTRKKVKELEKIFYDAEVNGENLSDEQVAKKMGVTVEELHQLYAVVGSSYVLSMDDVIAISDEDVVTVESQVENRERERPEDEFYREYVIKEIADLLMRLPFREKAVLYLYYYHRLSLKEIGAILDVTESRVSQIHTKALLKIKSKLQTLKKG